MVGDAWSGWMTAYYGGRNGLTTAILFGRMALSTPEFSQGVYPEGGGPEVSRWYRTSVLTARKLRSCSTSVRTTWI